MRGVAPTMCAVLLALGALVAEFAFGLAGLREAPFGTLPRWSAVRLAPWLVDGALAASAALAIDGHWLHRVFPSLALLAALHLPKMEAARDFQVLVRDRAVLAAAFAVAAAFGVAEPAIMAAALALLALNIAQSGARRG